jgi:hypothetical protein
LSTLLLWKNSSNQHTCYSIRTNNNVAMATYLQIWALNI